MKRLSFGTRIKGALDGWRMPFAGFGMGHGYGNGFIPKSWDWNFWQEGKDPIHLEACSAVEAGVSAYAQTVAMLPGMVWQRRDDNGLKALPDSPLAKVLANPNDYQTRSDFILNQVRALYFRGNAYAFGPKDRDGITTSLHPIHPDHVAPYVNRDTNDIFWSVAPTDLTPGAKEWPLDNARLVPDEFIWHVHMATPFHPLCGVSPLTSCALSIATNVNMNRQTLAFLANMSRPSGTLNTDLKMSAANVEELRQRWKAHSQGDGIGGTPILTHGLKWTALNLDAPDSQLIEFYKLSIADIARALRIPLPLIGVMDQATFNNAETLMQFWKASGLGWLLEHIELSLDKFFGLPQGQFCEFDTDALLRSEFKTRIDALARGVQGGIYSPNEARAREGLPEVDGGEMPRVQQQLVALDWEPPEPAEPAAPALPAPAANDEDDGGELTQQVERAFGVLGGHVVELQRGHAVLMDRSERAAELVRELSAERQATAELRERVAQLEHTAEAQAARQAETTARLDTLAREPGPPGEPGRNGSLFETWRGDWSIDEIYQAGDVVQTSDGAVWIAQKLTHDWPVEDSDSWRPFLPAPKPGRGFNHRGVFVPGMGVEPGDTVTGSEGAAWVWQGQAGTSDTCPGDAWSLMVKQGKNGRGKPGEPGKRGAPGATPLRFVRDGDDVLAYMSDGRTLLVEGAP